MSCENCLSSCVVTEDGKDFDAVMEIYDRLFPPSEKVPREALLQVAQSENGQLKIYKDGDTLCGFTFTIKDEVFTYLMFFAVNDTLQSKGYGSKIVQTFKAENSDRPILFAIEDPEEKGAENKEQRIRRRAFYEKNGFELTGSTAVSEKGDFLLMGTTKDVKSVYDKSLVFQKVAEFAGFTLNF